MNVMRALVILTTTMCIGCSIPPPLPVGPPASPRAYSSALQRQSYYDRYREEKHRRKVEKELRDIKRNTQRAKGDKLR
jgi:hypothetical protein